MNGNKRKVEEMGDNIFTPNKEFAKKKTETVPKTPLSLYQLDEYREGMFVVVRDAEKTRRIAKISSEVNTDRFLTIRVFNGPGSETVVSVDIDECFPVCVLEDGTFPDTETWESLRRQLAEARLSMA